MNFSNGNKKEGKGELLYVRRKEKRQAKKMRMVGDRRREGR